MRGFLVVGAVLLAGVMSAPSAEPTCEQQVELQIRQLAEAQLLTWTPGLPPAQSLVLLGSALRAAQTRVEMKGQQLDLAERNVAALLEQLRQATVREQEARREVETLKAKEPPAP